MPTDNLTLQSPKIILDFAGHPFAGQLFLGRYHLARATEGLATHRHPGSIEICYLAKGVQVYEVGQRRYVMTGNDIYVTYPNEEHSTGDSPQEKGTLYWLQVGWPEPGQPFLTFTADYARPLLERLLAIPRRHFRANWNVQRLFEETLVVYFTQHGPLQEIALATVFVELLLEILRCSELAVEDSCPDDINRCLHYIEENITEQTTIEQLAELMNLSPSRFKAKFKEAVGIPPAEYCTRRKIERAKELLRDHDISITAIAYALGFSSSQYFATVFKRYTNQHPGGYRGASR